MFRHMLESLLVAFGLITFPALPSVLTEEEEWELYELEAYAEYADEFTRLFDSLEYKRSKNGRSMIRKPGDKSFKFVSMGA